MSRKRPSLERLKVVLHYDHETGVFRRLLGVRGHAAGEVAGSINNLGYVQIKLDGSLFGAHRLAWLYVHGVWPAALIDHIDRDRANNRIANLREVTPSQNAQNSGAHRDSSSAFKGVSLHKKGRWRAEITHDGTTKFLGVYPSEQEAAQAYLLKSIELHTHRAANV